MYMNNEKFKSSLRKRADTVKALRCKNLIAVLEEPSDIKNIGMTVRNINALGVEKLYVIDSKERLPKNWQEMRENKSLMGTSVSAIKWTFVKTFASTEECIAHLRKKLFTSVVTSPHIKRKNNIILHKGNYTQKRLAVWFGNEANGISDLAVSESEDCINIQMCGIIESFNLATSTGIVLYEIARQRREYQELNKHGKKTDPKVHQE